MKVGYIGAYYWVTSRPSTNNFNISYRFNNSVPNQITENLNSGQASDTRVRMNAAYWQDTWTKGRLTLQGALRYDHAWSYYPEQQIGPTRFLPTAVVFPETQGVVGYNDVDPRFGVAYDLFGNGKTALKLNVGRYLEAAVGGNGNYSQLLPSSRFTTSVTRTWTDANRDFTPQCELENPLANGECAQISDLNFGKTVNTLSYDPNIMQGWYNRPSDWIIGATVQHEVLPRVSVSAGYTRRWLQHFTVTDNRAQSVSDYTPFSITAPSDPRLPNGGGYVIDGLYNVVQPVASLVDNYRTYSKDISQVYNGIDLGVNIRMRDLQMQAGTNTGQRVTDYCAVRAVLPEQNGGFSTGSEVTAFSPLNPYCHYAPGMDTRFTAAAAYTIPKIDVLLSGTFLSSPGIPLRADWTITQAGAPALWTSIQQQLGRPLSNSATSIVVNLLKPDDQRSERVNNLDFRVGKILRLGRTRANVSLDLLNALNLSTILLPNQAFNPGGAWLTPTGTQTPVMTARTAKITVQYDF
jgi:hypothetical protein